MPKKFYSSDIGDYIPISITPVLSKIFEKIVAGKLRNFLEANSLLLLSALCLLSKIYQRVDRPLHEHMHNFVAARNTRASAA